MKYEDLFKQKQYVSQIEVKDKIKELLNDIKTQSYKKNIFN